MTQEEKLLNDEVLRFMETESNYTRIHKLFIANEILYIIDNLGLKLKSSNWYDEQRTNERMKVIGQNGNEGTHYNK